MTEPGDATLGRIEQALAERNSEYDLPESLLSSSEYEDETAAPATGRRVISSNTIEDARFPHLRKYPLTGTIRAHTQIYVVNERIIHGKSTWSSSLCAFDSLHSANIEARTHAIFQHAKGDASIVQVYFRNGYGTWTTTLDTERGRITKSVFVNATVLQYLANPPIHQHEEHPVPGDRILPSKVPGSQRIRQIQAFRSTDSIRMESEQSNSTRFDVLTRHPRLSSPALHENTAKRNQLLADTGAPRNDAESEAKETAVNASKENTVRKQRSIEDLRDFASLHMLF